MTSIQTLTGAFLVVAATASAVAQHDHHAAQQPAAATSSLTAEAVQQLLNGDGMGLARPAELNRYPGPKHVLELKSQLGVTGEQEKKVDAIRQQMLAAAKPLGRSIVEAERALDEAFKSGRISEADVALRTAAIAKQQGELRRVHLHAHLLTRAILTAEQVNKYTSFGRRITDPSTEVASVASEEKKRCN